MFGISNKAMVEHSFCFIFFLLRIENDYIITESHIEYIYALGYLLQCLTHGNWVKYTLFL